MARPQFDVTVIGSGAGGGSVAWALATRGVKVLVLEAGPAYDYLKDYRLDQEDWEQFAFPLRSGEHSSYSFAPLQTLDPARDNLRSWNHITGRSNTGSTRATGRYLHVSGVGGSTLHFTGEAHRMHPQAMHMRSRFGVAADWPFDYAELEPWYQQAERVIGVAGPDRETVRWRSQAYPLPAHPFSYASQKMAEGCRQLGLNLTSNPLGILSQAYDGRPPCNYCANCGRGCPRGDKASVDVTFIRKALQTKRCTLRPLSRVIQIEAGERDRIGSVIYLDARGLRQRVASRAVVVACGAVHTPRLLLASAGRHAPQGLANESGQVGRHFMETTAWVSSALHPEPLGSHRGVPADAICWDYNAPDAVSGLAGGCRFTVGAAQAGFTGPVSYATRVVKGWGRAHQEEMRASFGRVMTVLGMGESLPNEQSFIDLDPLRKDKTGMPLARIHSHVGETDVRRLAFMADTGRRMLAASGAGPVFEEYGTYDTFTATHVFGTCRMGRDPAQSVVDATGRSHRWRNLYIADASVFPSSGGGEAPSLTIEALGIRTASLLHAALKRGDI